MIDGDQKGMENEKAKKRKLTVEKKKKKRKKEKVQNIPNPMLK